MKLEIDNVLEEISREEKGPFTLYFSKEIFSEFKKKCGKYPPSRVLERLMRVFLESKKAG